VVPQYSTNTLVATAFAKLASLGIALGFGFVGGQIFPMVFAGACVGSAIHQVVPSLPVAMVVPCCVVAVPSAIVPAPLSFISLASVMLSLGGVGTAPVAVACVVSHTTICGIGIIQRAVSLQLEKMAIPDIAIPDIAIQDGSQEARETLHMAPVDDRCHPCSPSLSPISTVIPGNSSPQAGASTSNALLPEPLRSSLAGQWLCVRNEGDSAKQLELMGVGWVQRKAAKALSYGVGKVVQTVWVDGLTVTIESPAGSTSFVVDGSEQIVPLPGESRPANAIVGLEGSVIDITVVGRGVHLRRWVDGDRMMVLTEVKGLTTTREFAKVV